MKREYRKRYWPLALWMLALAPVMAGAAVVAERAGLGAREMTAVSVLALLALLIALFALIWRGEYVYWISGGPDYEQARSAGSEPRREYAWRHLRAMLLGSLAALVLLTAAYFCGAPELVMVLSAAACVVAAAVSTVRIRWMGENDDSEN